MLKVIGIDPSITAPGFCRWGGSTFTIKTKPSDGDVRLQVIRNAVHDIAFGADLAVIELPPPGLKGPAIPSLHMVQAAVRLDLIDTGVPYLLVNPTTLKAFATGNPSADKPTMAVQAYKRAGVEFADDNQCDAFWLRVIGLTMLGRPPFELPAAQTKRLSGLTLPASVLAKMSPAVAA